MGSCIDRAWATRVSAGHYRTYTQILCGSGGATIRVFYIEGGSGKKYTKYNKKGWTGSGATLTTSKMDFYCKVGEVTGASNEASVSIVHVYYSAIGFYRFTCR